MPHFANALTHLFDHVTGLFGMCRSSERLEEGCMCQFLWGLETRVGRAEAAPCLLAHNEKLDIRELNWYKVHWCPQTKYRHLEREGTRRREA